MALHKYEELHLPYRLSEPPAPTAGEIERPEEALSATDYMGHLHH